jgi:hypothetical protein
MNYYNATDFVALLKYLCLLQKLIVKNKKYQVVIKSIINTIK